MQVLEVPHELSGVRIQGQRRIRIQSVVRDARSVDPLQQRSGIVGLPHSEIRQIEPRVVAAGGPDRRPVSLLEREPVPTVSTRLTWARDRMEAPGLLAGLGIERHDHTATRRLTCDALHDLALCHQGSARHLPAHLVIGDGGIPQHGPGFHIECHDVIIRSRHEQLLAIEAEIASDVQPHITRKQPRVLPEQIARSGVQGLHDITVTGDENHSIVLQRRRLVPTVWERPRPGHPQLIDVALRDLLQWAETVIIVRATPGQPLARRGLLQHLVGDGSHLVQRIGKDHGCHRRSQGRQRHHRRRGGHGAAWEPHRDERVRVCRQLPISRRTSIHLHEVGQELCSRLRRQRADIRRGHSGVNEREQRLGRFPAPVLTERIAVEGTCELTAAQISAVTARAVLRIGGLPLRGLLGGKRGERPAPGLLAARLFGQRAAGRQNGGRTGASDNQASPPLHVSSPLRICVEYALGCCRCTAPHGAPVFSHC